MYRLDKRVFALVLGLALVTARPLAGFGTTVPISEQLGTEIASRMFPVSLGLEVHTLFLTEPRLRYLDAQRVGLEVRFQAYDYRPEDAVAVSEKGTALISGVLDYDATERQVLLLDPKIDTLEFDNRNNGATAAIRAELRAAWKEWATDTVRTDLPEHPYMLPFRNNIQSLSYDGRQIKLGVLYQ